MTIKSLFRFWENEQSGPRFLAMANFIVCLPPEIPRDIFFYPINPKVRAKMVGIVNKVYSLSALPKRKMYTAISRKAVGISARDNLERHCGWFWVLCFSKKFKRIGTKGHGNVFASPKGEQQKKVRQLQSSGTVYWLYPILPFRDCRLHIFSDNLSRNSCKPILEKRPLRFNARLLEITFNSIFTRQSTIRAQFLSTRR